MTAVSSALDYFLGLGIFGFLYWFLNGVLVDLRIYAYDSDILRLVDFIWAGALILYLILGAFWLPRVLKEWDQNKRGGRR